MHRHARQARLAGVGSDGQARIASAQVDVPLEGLAAEVAARYLAGAGVARLRVRSRAVGEAARAVDGRVQVEVDVDLPLEVQDATVTSAIRDPAARELAA